MSETVDVVVPTFNCAGQLRRCLTQLRRQKFDGHLNLIVVDGGSTDGTLAVATEFGANTYVNPGQYGTGLTGARHFGETKGSADFVWNLDADNFIVEPDAVAQLMIPFRSNSHVQLSIPETTVDSPTSPLNEWTSLAERSHVDQMKRAGKNMGSWVLVNDVTYGLTNATILRRQALEKCGGYDSDVRLLARLRQAGLSCGAIVPSVHVIHEPAMSVIELRAKWVRRVLRFSKMTGSDLEDYFVEYPPSRDSETARVPRFRWTHVMYPLTSVFNYFRTGQSVWLLGLMYPLLIGSILVSHPVACYRVWRNFLR